MKRHDFYFDLPADLIAQRPALSRDSSRLLVVDAATKSFFHSSIYDLPDILPLETICVPNDVKVRHARLLLRKSGGGNGEALLLHSLTNGRFEALVRPGKYFQIGKQAQVIDALSGKVVAELLVEGILDEGLRIVKISNENGNLDWDIVDHIGKMPLPHYIKQQVVAEDEERYQTVFHSNSGEAVAAPTAGLHFTDELILRLKKRNSIIWSPVCLHVGLGTFRPVMVDSIEDHNMHEERYEITDDTAKLLQTTLRQRSNPILAIGTTSLRTLEAAWDGSCLSQRGKTQIFIKPGYKISTADMLLTNFHLPESTLFILITALLGFDFAHSIYAEAIKERYRFFSYGDAMLIFNIRQSS